MTSCAVDLNLKVDQIGRTLEPENKYGELTCVLVQFLASALAFPLHLLE